MIDKTNLLDILNKVTDKTNNQSVSTQIEKATLDLDIKELKRIMVNLYREVLSDMGLDPDEGMIDMFEAVDAHIEDESVTDKISEIQKAFKQE
jgi:signal transduction histidine kinase